MADIFVKHNWRKIAALAMALCLLVLLLHPAQAHNAAFAGLVLQPVWLFGLVLVPRSLWPAADPDPHPAQSVLCHAARFQRPPPPVQN